MWRNSPLVFFHSRWPVHCHSSIHTSHILHATSRSVSTSADMKTKATCSSSYTHTITLTKINLRTFRHLLLCLLCWFLRVQIYYCKDTRSPEKLASFLVCLRQSCVSKFASMDERETVRVSVKCGTCIIFQYRKLPSTSRRVNYLAFWQSRQWRRQTCMTC